MGTVLRIFPENVNVNKAMIWCIYGSNAMNYFNEIFHLIKLDIKTCF